MVTLNKYFAHKKMKKIFISYDGKIYDEIISIQQNFLLELREFIEKGDFNNRIKLNNLVTKYDFFKEIRINKNLKKFEDENIASVKNFLEEAELKKVRGATTIGINGIKFLIKLSLKDYYEINDEQEIEIKKGMLETFFGNINQYQKVTLLEKVLNLPYEKINSIFYDSNNIIGRMITFDSYKDNPKQKFLYGEGIEFNHPHIRYACKNALIKQYNELPDGVTKEQIDSGIYSGIDSIRGGGLLCSHSFFPATDFAINLMKKRIERE